MSSEGKIKCVVNDLFREKFFIFAAVIFYSPAIIFLFFVLHKCSCYGRKMSELWKKINKLGIFLMS
jgi:hypothetical protein